MSKGCGLHPPGSPVSGLEVDMFEYVYVTLCTFTVCWMHTNVCTWLVGSNIAMCIKSAIMIVLFMVPVHGPVCVCVCVCVCVFAVCPARLFLFSYI